MEYVVIRYHEVPLLSYRSEPKVPPWLRCYRLGILNQADEGDLAQQDR